jgi:CHAD domain-containing protein
MGSQHTIMHKKNSNTAQLVLESIYNQIDFAFDQLNGSVLSSERLVHELRKCIKRIKALYYLLKPLMDQKTFYMLEKNITQAGHILSEQRDSTVNLETFEILEKNSFCGISPSSKAEIREVLAYNINKAYNNRHNAFNNRIFRISVLLKRFRNQLNINYIEQADANFFINHIEKNFYSAQTFYKHSKYKPEREIVHSWRKSMKRLLLQLKFSPIVPAADTEFIITKLEYLTEILGWEHDLAILSISVQNMALTDSAEKNYVLTIIHDNRRRLLGSAYEHAGVLFSNPFINPRQEIITA